MCNGVISGGNVVIYIWGVEFKVICIGSFFVFNGVLYLVVKNIYIYIIKMIC